jgi:hypothetical protein
LTETLVGENEYGETVPCIDTLVVEELFAQAVGPVGLGLAEWVARGLAECVAAVVAVVRAGVAEVWCGLGAVEC